MYQETSVFFKWVFRFNALMVLAFFCAIGVFIAGELVRNTPNFNGSYRVEENFTQGDTHSDIGVHFSLGVANKVVGHDAYLMEQYVYSSPSSSYLSSSGSSSNAVNYGFLQVPSGDVSWVFDEAQLNVSHWDILGKTRSSGALIAGDTEVSLAHLFVYSSVPAGQERHHAGEHDDIKKHVILTRPDGRETVQILDNIDSIVNVEAIDEQTVMLIFERMKKSHVAFISLDDFSVRSQKAIDFP